MGKKMGNFGGLSGVLSPIRGGKTSLSAVNAPDQFSPRRSRYEVAPDGNLAWIVTISAASAPWWFPAVMLSALCLLIRSQGLMAMPIFGDEAIYLRWAQLVRPDGGGHWWVSLVDPKPPLHFWILAAVFDWTRDPLAAARGVSVLSGVLCVPAVMLVCEELGRLARPVGVISSGRAVGLIAAILMIFCPFLAFYQRLATADALFVLEMLGSRRGFRCDGAGAAGDGRREGVVAGGLAGHRDGGG